MIARICKRIATGAYIAIVVFAWSLCAAAKRGDRVHLPAPEAEDAAA